MLIDEQTELTKLQARRVITAWLICTLALTLVLAVLPFAIHGLERARGINIQPLPGPHGPWWGTPAENTIFNFLFLFSGFTFVLGVWLGARYRTSQAPVAALCLAGFQFALGIVQFLFLGWLVD